MPPRPKRTRLHPTRTKSQFKASAQPEIAKPDPLVEHAPAVRRTRSNMIMEVVLPASKKLSRKSSSAPTLDPQVAADSSQVEQVQDQDRSTSRRSLSRLLDSPAARASTPRATSALSKTKGKQRMDSLPPSSPPPNSSPSQPVWDSSVGSTPTPSPSRSRHNSRQPSLVSDARRTGKVLVPGTPSSQAAASQLRFATSKSVPSQIAAPKPPTQRETQPTQLETQPTEPPPTAPSYHPPTSPEPYTDTAAPDDPFGFLAAEGRLRDRRAALEREGYIEGGHSSAGTGEYSHLSYEEAFATMYDEAESAIDAHTNTAGSDKENERGVGSNRRQSKMEVVIPTKGKSKEPKEPPARGHGRRRSTEHVLTTYELEAMLPRRQKRARKPTRNEEVEQISLSENEDEDDEDEEVVVSRKRKAAGSKGKAGSMKNKKAAPKGKGRATRRGGAQGNKGGPSASTKPTIAPSKRVRSFDTSHMDDETRKRFETERKRRLEQYKSLDGYMLEEEEVVW